MIFEQFGRYMYLLMIFNLGGPSFSEGFARKTKRKCSREGSKELRTHDFASVRGGTAVVGETQDT